MIVVADTSPLNYLILIDQVGILQALYGTIVIPPAVQNELLHPSAPRPVQTWIQTPPAWLEVHAPGRTPLALSSELDEGEREAIALAHSSGRGAILLIDERIGRHEALRLGLSITGTLGVLEQAHLHGLLDLHEAVQRLSRTTFKVSDSVLDRFLNPNL